MGGPGGLAHPAPGSVSPRRYLCSSFVVCGVGCGLEKRHLLGYNLLFDSVEGAAGIQKHWPEFVKFTSSVNVGSGLGRLKCVSDDGDVVFHFRCSFSSAWLMMPLSLRLEQAQMSKTSKVTTAAPVQNPEYQVMWRLVTVFLLCAFLSGS